jgi:hypothetical protein
LFDVLLYHISLCAGILAAVVTILSRARGWERQEEDVKYVSVCPGYVLLAKVIHIST